MQKIKTTKELIEINETEIIDNLIEIGSEIEKQTRQKRQIRIGSLKNTNARVYLLINNEYNYFKLDSEYASVDKINNFSIDKNIIDEIKKVIDEIKQQDKEELSEKIKINNKLKSLLELGF